MPGKNPRLAGQYSVAECTLTSCPTSSKTLRDLVVDAKSRVSEISASDAAVAIKADSTTLVFEVREPAEWAEGHIPAVLLVPRGRLEAQTDLEYAIREPRPADRRQAIIVHCAAEHAALWPPTCLRKWASRMCAQWRAVSPRGKPQGWRQAPTPQTDEAALLSSGTRTNGNSEGYCAQAARTSSAWLK